MNLILVYHADGALKIAPACPKFKLTKAECLALLGRVEVRIERMFAFFIPLWHTTKAS